MSQTSALPKQLIFIALLCVMSNAQVAVAQSSCAGLAATITGSGNDDYLVGTDGDDVIVGLGGRDIILGMGGADTICGGDGVDILVGMSGADRLFGDDGDDFLIADAGSDQLVGGAGDDVLDGGTDSLGRSQSRVCRISKAVPRFSRLMLINPEYCRRALCGL